VSYVIWAICLAIGVIGVVMIIASTRKQNTTHLPSDDDELKSKYEAFRHSAVVTDTEVCSTIGRYERHTKFSFLTSDNDN
jgi:hypothetical protein